MRQPRQPRQARREPWHPASWGKADAEALQVLAADKAHKRALAWIIERAAMTYDDPFVPGDANTSAYLAGRMSVGKQIVKLINVDLEKIDNG